MYVLGVDGGGTKTKACLMNEYGDILGIGIAGPSSIDTVPLEVSLKNISQAIFHSFKEEHYSISAAYLGLGGVVSREDGLKVSIELSKLDFFEKAPIILTENDTRTALAGGLATKEGIAVIIGTGSVAFGKNLQGEKWISGGYGYKEGDAGSSYDLGRQALKITARALDGRITTTPFILEVLGYLGITNNKVEFIKKLDELWVDRTATAALAPLVTRYGNLEDMHAVAIIDKATSELALMVEAVYRKISLANKQVAVIGSLGNAEGLFKHSFIDKVKFIDKELEVIPQRLDPSVGAALQALKLRGLSVNEEMIARHELCHE